MGRSSIPPALIELSNPTTPEAQVNALRDLKNEIVGHDQRKELAVRHGVVKPLAGILRAEARRGGKRRGRAMNGNGSVEREGEKAMEWSTEDEMRYQATLVVGSLAIGGPAFVTPLLAGNILPPLLEALSPNEVSPKLIVATLRTLTLIVDAMAHEKPWTDSSDGPLRPSISNTISEQIYTRQVMDRLAEILSQTSQSPTVHQQISATTKLIINTCREERQRKLLLEAGTLDILATKLAAIALADAQSLRMEPRTPSGDELPVVILPDIMEAIATIITDSYYHTARFLYSQPIQRLFGTNKESAAGTYDGYSTSPQTTPWDRLLPRLQATQTKADHYTKSWPALGSHNSAGTNDSYTRLPSMGSLQQPANRNPPVDEPENPLFIWLTFVARRGQARERLSACWLLAILKKFGEKWSGNDPSKSTRGRHFSYFIVPLVVKMIEEATPRLEQSKKNGSLSPQAKEDHKYILKHGPFVLAELVKGNKMLQDAAVDAKVLPMLYQILKKSFDPVITSSKPLWSPRPPSPQPRDSMIDPASSTLGRPGLSTEILHAFRYRESSLVALGALADIQDGLRKVIIESGAVNYIIDSLVPYSEGLIDPSSSTQDGGSTTAKGGNPVPVLIAACKAVQTLSRSISVLRTSLIDHGVAKPSYDLLRHPNVKVQTAATEVITNLVLEVSPMRDVSDIIAAGALKTLCEHCHSANFDLRYGSLWALKHLCLSSSYETKVKCLEELGVGWLVQALNGEPTKSSISTPLGMGTSNAAGEQVDILNAVDDPNMDVDDDTSDDEDENTMTDSIPSMRHHHRAGSRYTNTTNIRDRLQHIKNDEQDPRINAERDDVRIQEQALDFIRNFTNENKASGEMIDYLLKTIGHSRFFEILDSKVRPKGAAGQTNTSTYWPNTLGRTSGLNPSPFTTNPNWAAYPPTEIISAALYILVHLANGRSQHRSLVISQTQLMTHVLQLFSHPNRSVRVPCAWFINNLTWVDDSTDVTASRERAQNLRQLGYEEGLRMLTRDADLDVRERGKGGVEQLAKLLGEDRPTGYSSPAGVSAFGESAGGVSGLGRVGGGLGSLHQHRGWTRE
ncbi:ARM repeat-containing protein [Zopfia rhizophila CBS 207.26]|uniref:ARM repeat-containing protein n=1 Tax=Zopfia rhizophila CBS 207.26 TaxID=1314779 RepID=A0A6A6DPP7_9PEZI|nr:ARM repeat-containing protein [Zopfia rhizophila CBS 207.26]